MHICDAHLSLLPQNSTWEAGREIEPGVLEGRRRNSTVTQTWSTASPLLLPAFLWEQIVIPHEPACNPVPRGWELLLHPLPWAESEHCCVLTTRVDSVPGFVFPFHPMVLQTVFFPVFPEALLVLVLLWIKHLIWNNLKIPLLEILLEYMPWGKRADFPQLQNSGQVGKKPTFLEVVLGLWRAFSTWNQQSKKENKL